MGSLSGGKGHGGHRRRPGHPRAEPHWGRSLSVPAPPLGMACRSYLLPILSPPPPPREARPHPSPATYPPPLPSAPLLCRELPEGLPAVSPSPYLPGSQPSRICWLSALWPLIRCPLSTSAPLSAGSLAHTHCYFFLFLMETRGKQPQSRALHFSSDRRAEGVSDRPSSVEWRTAGSTSPEFRPTGSGASERAWVQILPLGLDAFVHCMGK